MKVEKKKKREMLCSSNPKCSESEEGPAMALPPWLHPSTLLQFLSFRNGKTVPEILNTR